MRIIVFFTCLSLLLSPAAYSTDLHFDVYNKDFDSAKLRAGEEGKLFFVEFCASWCAPCKWMEETTFQDVEVQKILAENYLTMQIDIDDLDGYEIKQRFKVKVLPTLMVFNSSGKMIARIEETLSARQLAKLLNHHNTEENREVVTHSLNTSPSLPDQPYESFTPPDRKTVDAKSEVFKIQLGVFSDRVNATSWADELSITFSKPITVASDSKNDRIIYRVMLGAFEERQEAIAFQKVLSKEYDLEGFVKKE